MKPFNYDPLNSNVPKTTANSRKRMLSEIGQKAINDVLSKENSNFEYAESKNTVAEQRSSVLGSSFESIFNPLEIPGLLTVLDGKVLVKTNSTLESIADGLIVIGFVTGGVAAKNTSIDGNTLSMFWCIGIGLIILGFVLKKAFGSYAVFDNKQQKVYKECFFFSTSIYKSKAISKSQIIEVAVDHRNVEGNVNNVSGAMTHGEGVKRESVESAIVFLLKNGKLAYFNSFMNFEGAEEFFQHVAMSISAVWNLSFKNASSKKKFIVKRLQGKFVLFATDINKEGVDGVLSSMLRIVLGVFFAIGSIVLVFWLVYKFV